MAKKTYTKEQQAICEYIKHCREEFRKKGILYSAFARALGISLQHLHIICSYNLDNSTQPAPSAKTLLKYKKRLDELLEYHDMQNKDCDPSLFI